jgi:hypothetical protein
MDNSASSLGGFPQLDHSVCIFCYGVAIEIIILKIIRYLKVLLVVSTPWASKTSLALQMMHHKWILWCVFYSVL